MRMKIHLKQNADFILDFFGCPVFLLQASCISQQKLSAVCQCAFFVFEVFFQTVNFIIIPLKFDKFLLVLSYIRARHRCHFNTKAIIEYQYIYHLRLFVMWGGWLRRMAFSGSIVSVCCCLTCRTILKWHVSICLFLHECIRCTCNILMMYVFQVCLIWYYNFKSFQGLRCLPVAGPFFSWVSWLFFPNHTFYHSSPTWK